ncbi:arylamine N-acetyltransferase [bacterium]|nr:arylamine N-acetyltransferase [bacterium]
MRATDRLLARFGSHRPATPTRAGLGELYHAFSHLPYENVSKVLGAARHGGVWLQSPSELIEGFLASRLGGTCFSLTQGLYDLLVACGFEARRVLGDMQHGNNIHCAVLVALEGALFLCDPGYLLPEPLELPTAVGAETLLRGEVYTYIVRRDQQAADVIHLFTRPQSGSAPPHWRYRIRAAAVEDSTFEFHWRRTFEDSMMHQLVLTRAAEGGQLYVHNRKLRVTQPGGRQNSNLSGSVGAAVEELFGIDRELVEAALRQIERAKAAGKAVGG